MKNSLQTSTIKKIFREHFMGEVPIVKCAPEKKMLISEIKKKLTTMKGFAPSDRYYYPYTEKKSEEICHFKVLSPSQHYNYPIFTIRFNAQNELLIEQWNVHSSLVYHLEQIYTLFDKITVELKRLDANYLKSQSKRQSDQIKREKIKGLKRKAIIARIHEIAKEERLEFYLIEHATKFKLAIRLAKSEKMEIDIPYSKFQEILQNLRVMIQTIREFHDLGITLKMRRTGYRDPKWITYKDEQNSP
jgi:hypothetical protein